MARWLLITIVSIATLIALVYTEENWRGKRAWEATKKELLAKGERLDIQAFIPEEIPNEQNAAGAPFFSGLLDYSKTTEGHPLWKDSNSIARAEIFGAWLTDPAMNFNVSHGWNEMKRVNLADIQSKMLKVTNSIKHSTVNGASFEIPPPAHLPATSAPSAEILFVISQIAGREEIRSALKRPRARFPIHYQEHFAALVPHLRVLQQAAKVFTVQALAELEAGKVGEALDDTTTALALAEMARNEPWLISALNRMAILQMALQPLWEGLADHRWNDEQLRTFTEQLSKVDLLADFQRDMRSELAFTIYAVESTSRKELISMLDHPAELLTFAPRGWIDQNLAVVARAHAEMSIPLVDVANRRVFPAKAKQVMSELGPRFENKPFGVLAHAVFPAVTSSLRRFAFIQSSVNQAILACALERFRLANGRYPEKLEELSPRFLTPVPHDVITGAPLKYARRGTDNFVLYSIGWDEKDDGGIPVKNGSSRQYVANESGDWVWAYPEK